MRRELLYPGIAILVIGVLAAVPDSFIRIPEHRTTTERVLDKQVTVQPVVYSHGYTQYSVPSVYQEFHAHPFHSEEAAKVTYKIVMLEGASDGSWPLVHWYLTRGPSFSSPPTTFIYDGGIIPQPGRHVMVDSEIYFQADYSFQGDFKSYYVILNQEPPSGGIITFPPAATVSITIDAKVEEDVEVNLPWPLSIAMFIGGVVLIIEGAVLKPRRQAAPE